MAPFGHTLAHMDVKQFQRWLPCLQCLLVCLPPAWLCGCACGRAWYILKAKRWMKRHMDLDLDIADLSYSIQSEPLLIVVEVRGLRIYTPYEWNEFACEEALIVPELRATFRRGLDDDKVERLCARVTILQGATVMYDTRNAFLSDSNIDCIIRHIQASKFGREQAAREAARKGETAPLLPKERPLVHLSGVDLQGISWIRMQQNGQKSVLPDIQVPEFQLRPSEVNSPIKVARFINRLVANEISKFLAARGQALVDAGGAIGLAVVAAGAGTVQSTQRGANTIGNSLTHNHRIHCLRDKNARRSPTSPTRVIHGRPPVVSPMASPQRSPDKP